MSKEKKNIIQLIVLLIILVIVIIVAVRVFNRKKILQNEEPINEGTSYGIDVNAPAYEGMKIYQENGDIIIEQEDGGKTIETTKTKNNTGLKNMTDDTKKKYEISEVQVSQKGGGTIIIGKVKNNDNVDHTIIINIKFYSEDNKIKGAASTKMQIGKAEIKDFTMSIMDTVSQYKYNIIVEYSD